MATCQYCGREFGNEGAKTNHERACDSNPTNQGGGQAHASQQAQRGQQARPPARQQQPAQQGGQMAPANQGASAGGSLADAFIAMTDGDLPAEQRRDAIKGGLGVVGDMIFRYQEYRERKMDMQRQRAQNVQLEEETAYPECNECGYQFGAEDIGINDSQVRCPECTKLYTVRDGGDEGEPIDAQPGE